MALVSAHEYGVRYGRREATAAEHLAEVLELRPDFVEFDVRRTADGAFVVRHDAEVIVGGRPHRVRELTLAELRAAASDVLMYDDALAAVRGRASAHLDLKLSPPASTYRGADEDTWEVVATARAVDVLGPSHLVVTTGRDRGVVVLRRWAASACPDLLVGLSLGGSRAGQSWRRQAAGRWSELFPARRVAACDPTVIVANRWLALFGVARWTHRHGLLLLVWTVDDPGGLRRWLADPRCWMVTTNQVHQAVRVRDGYRG